jgi:predicted nucleotidyltransferase
MMNDRADANLSRIADRLSGVPEVGRVVLFGSRARGTHSAESDYDIAVILRDDIEHGRFTPAYFWRLLSDLCLPVQVVALRAAVFERARQDRNTLSHDIARDGRDLFSRAQVVSA